MLVSVAGGGGEGGSVGEGKGGGVGRKNEGEGEIWAIMDAGGRIPVASSWLNKKLPISIPTLMSAMARLPSSCPVPVAGSLPGLLLLPRVARGGVRFLAGGWPGGGPNISWALEPSCCCCLLTALAPLFL